MPRIVRRVTRRRRRVARRPGARRYGRYGIKARLARAFNPVPSFVETYKDSSVINVPPGGGVGYVFKVRITDLPQVLQYSNLYTQYRINWARVMLIPRISTATAEPNSAIQNTTLAPVTQWMGLARIVYAINDSPGVAAPASEQEVLECNGARVKPFRAKWQCSFRPVPDTALVNPAVGNAVYTRSRYRQWFNFDSAATANNPEHGSVSAYISLPGNVPAGDPFNQTYYIYWKLSFSLRDPK